MSRLLIAAAHKSSGKTVVTTGLAGALVAQGMTVQCFKKGPDYIDPMWLKAASGRSCYNLDFNTMTSSELVALLCSKNQGADLDLIESNKGLYDGVALSGMDSNAELAKALSTPVVLVIDTMGMTRGIAPLLLGYSAFDLEVEIAGVILNKVGGPRHEGKLRAAVEAYTDTPVVGAVWRNEALDIGERHLGLTTPAETLELDAKIAKVSGIVGSSVDLERLKQIARDAPSLSAQATVSLKPDGKGLRIAIARDASFGFYYPDDLEAFRAFGAELVPFDTLTDTRLPDVDGLFIGGGFPETQMKALSGNHALKENIKRAIRAGLPAYAECGGLMYLCRSMFWDGNTLPMCDVVDGDAIMCSKPQGRGYVEYTATPDHPWETVGGSIKGHEFHYAKIENLGDETRFGMKLSRGSGICRNQDGVVTYNLLAGFCHQRHTSTNPWVEQFLGFVQKVKSTPNR
ncbi:MAG: cobyrinate a,c-diamide synthase [Rhodobacteraceae bacterium]|nr:cobyrinate a,c-diamide synthase [Paracoccaceae bacterium]